MKVRTICAVMILALWATMAPANGESPVGRSPGEGGTSEENRIQETLRSMWKALGEKDLESYASHLHPDFTAFGENDPYLASGKELELRSYASYLRRVRGLRTEMHQPRVTIRGDVAWITYYWTEEAITQEGQRQSSRGKSTRIFVKEDGRWLCIHGHYTAVP